MSEIAVTLRLCTICEGPIPASAPRTKLVCSVECWSVRERQRNRIRDRLRGKVRDKLGPRKERRAERAKAKERRRNQRKRIAKLADPVHLEKLRKKATDRLARATAKSLAKLKRPVCVVCAIAMPGSHKNKKTCSDSCKQTWLVASGQIERKAAQKKRYYAEHPEALAKWMANSLRRKRENREEDILYKRSRRAEIRAAKESLISLLPEPPAAGGVTDAQQTEPISADVAKRRARQRQYWKDNHATILEKRRQRERGKEKYRLRRRAEYERDAQKIRERVRLRDTADTSLLVAFRQMKLI